MIYLHVQRKLETGWSRVEVHRLVDGRIEPVSAVPNLSERVQAGLRRAVESNGIPDAFAGKPAYRVLDDCVFRVSMVTAFVPPEAELTAVPRD